MKAVSHEGHGVGEVADDDLDEEEGGGEAEHARQPAFLPRELALPPACAPTHLDLFCSSLTSWLLSLFHIITALPPLWSTEGAACFLLPL